ncbi:MAG: glycerol-3-phosphate 1-O-acyltransferase PlsY [Candidatus Krumholzibacteria bacterium]|nr:glycerol-3-phosphate 1-O-acyltransferase PlsY [Candidatus Krumholzibacteria bacterium]
MDSVVRFILILVPCYLLGSIPSSYIMGKLLRGIDLRQHGSGNLGAANTFRVLGAKAAVPVLLFDIGKGFLAVKIVGMFGVGGILQILTGVLVVILGHNYSIFVKFSGGKGVGTTAGAFLAMAPVAVGICFVIWAIILLMFRIVSVASIISALFLPVMILLANRFMESGTHVYVVVMSIIMAALVVYKHRSNLKRLSKGTEPRIF